MRWSLASCALVVVALQFSSGSAQLNKVAEDFHVDADANKFLQREAHRDRPGSNSPPDEIDDPDFCPQNLAVRWHTEVGSSVLATPLITDLFSDGRKDIIVPGFKHSLSVVEAADGARSSTFQAYHRSTLHTSPLLHDIDLDGVMDIVVATYDGEIHFYKDTGDEATYPTIIPRLKVKREWFKGLKADPIDHSHPDVGADGDDSGQGERAGGGQTQRRRRLMQANANAGVASDAATQGGQQQQEQGAEPGEQLSEEAADSFQELFAEDGGGEEGDAGGEEGEREWLNEDAADDFREDSDYAWRNEEQQGDAGEDLSGVLAGSDVRSVREGHQAQQERPPGAPGAHPPRRPPGRHAPGEPPEDPGADDYALHALSDYRERAKLWDSDDFGAAPDHTGDKPASPDVWIDAHIVATPAIADIDGDGREELVAAVSYFFDPGAYAASSARHAAAVGAGGDVANYVASGVVVYDLQTRIMKWSQHLDLSTAYTRYIAHAYSPPTLADVDRDGRLEVILGTSMGFVYVLDPATGSALEGWPVQMGDVTAQVAVGDLDGDGWLELVVGDGRGSVAALRPSGKELWERHLGSAVGAGATLADVDGDGRLEIILGTTDGRVHVLDGATGEDLRGFPFRAYGAIAAPVLATKLDDDASAGMQLAFVANDGFLYVVDALSACADSLDLGEASSAMVLAEDLAGSGRLDLLVTTLGGTLYAIRTAARYHPLKAWPAQAPGVGTAGCTARWSWEGVAATRDSRVPRDVRGDAVPVRFTLTDRRPALPGGKARGPYRVAVTLHGVGAKDMNAGDQPVIGMVDTLNTTGTYTIEIPCPRSRTTATVRVEIKDETGAVFADEFALSFHVHFYRLLKWLVVAPFAFTAAALLAYNGRAALVAQLPS